MTKTSPQEFFQRRRGLAEVKKEILPRILTKWAEIVLADATESKSSDSVFLVDLLAGQGITQDSAADSGIPQFLKTIFVSSGTRTDLNKQACVFFHDSAKTVLPVLKDQIEALSFYSELLHPPQFLQQEETREAWESALKSDQPVLFFLDPFGYKLSQEVWYQALERTQSDFVFFLDPKRLKAAVKNTKDEKVKAFFGDRLPNLAKTLQQNTNPQRKEEVMLQGFEQTLAEKGYRFTKFKINVPGKDQTDVYVCLVSKQVPLHTRFKEILLDYSEVQEDGVPRMGVFLKLLRLLVPEFHKYLPFSLEKLEQDLLQNAAVYQSMVLEKIYERHNVGTPYSRDNYFTIVEKLGQQGQAIFLNPKTAQTVRKLTFGCRIKFIGK